jgi:AbiV family abortive infection protein
MPKSKKKVHLTSRGKIIGMQDCYNNACSLKKEGILLLENNFWARATALFILGIEEISKVELIAATIFFNKDSQYEKFYKDFKSHNSKLKLADVLLLQQSYRISKENLEENVNEILKGRNLNIAKQKCLYVGLSNENSWIDPLKLVVENDAKYVLKLLEEMTKVYKGIFEKSYNEIVDYIKAVKKEIPIIRNDPSYIKMNEEIKKYFRKK